MLQSSKGFIIDASFIKLSTKKVGSFLLPITGEMGARYKKFSPMANQFYKFLHVLYSIIEG